MAGISTKPFKGDVYAGTAIAHTRLSITAAAAVDASTTINGQAGTWAKTGTGLYTYTFNASPDFKVAGSGYRTSSGTTPGGQVFLASVKGTASVFGAEVASLDLTTGSVVVRTFNESTGAAADPTTAMIVDMMIILFDSSVT